MSRHRYDLVIVGGGAAGFSALVKFREVAGHDKSVAMVSRGPLGGTCVNVGCVPSKYLIEAGKATRILRSLSGRGVAGGVHVDFKALMGSLRGYVEALRRGRYESLIDHYGADLYVGDARFRSPKTLVVGTEDGEKVIEGGSFIVATGSRPAVPRIEGVERVPYYTSDDIWGVEELPGSMLVVGGGAVGVELAQAFSRLGSRVDVVEALDRLLPAADPLISRALTSVLAEEGVGVFTKSRVSELSGGEGRIKARIVGPKGGLTREYDLVLIASGRRPNTSGLGLGEAGIEVDGRGFVRVSRHLRTSNPVAYAAGDVAGTPKPAFLETLAAREGALAAYNLATGSRSSIDYEAVPVVVFTDPEVAYVGLTEERLTELKGACSCRIAWFRSLPKSGIMGVEEGVAKIVVDPDEGSVRGFHALAPNASEFIGVAAMMVKHRYRVEDVLDTVLAFPTSSEIVKATAQAYIRSLDKMPCCVE